MRYTTFLFILLVGCQSSPEPVTESGAFELAAVETKPLDQDIDRDSASIAFYTQVIDDPDYTRAKDRDRIEMIERQAHEFFQAANAVSTNVDRPMAQELRKKLIALQMEDLPILRKQYAKALNAELKDRGITVTCGGKRNEHIIFSSARYIGEKSQDDGYVNWKHSLEPLRYKAVTFRGKNDVGKKYEVMSFDDEAVPYLAGIQY